MKLWAIHGALAFHGAVALAIGAASSGDELDAPAAALGPPARTFEVDVVSLAAPAEREARSTPETSAPAISRGSPSPAFAPGAALAYSENAHAAPSPETSPERDAPERFVMTVSAIVPSDTSRLDAPPAPASSAVRTTIDAREATEPARVLRSAEPAYPEAARSDGREADVELEVVVDEHGSVVDARVTRPAGEGFDEAALAAMRAYRFTPAKRDGGVVAVRLPWTVHFRLR